MTVNPPKPAQPAILDLATVHAQAAAEIEKKHAKALKQLRADHNAWLDRQAAISPAAFEKAEAELMDGWEQGLIPPGDLLTAPSHEAITARLRVAARRIETYGDKLERDAMPITADLLALIADKTEAAFLHRADEIDQQAKMEFGHSAGTAPRVISSCVKLREEAARFRSGSPAFALDRLRDYIEL